jgi:flagellar biogenesis protein FliO
LRSLLALVVVAAVLAALSLVLRAAGVRGSLDGRGGRFLRVLESTALGGGATLHLVRVGERYFVLTAGSGHASQLCEVAPQTLDAWRAAKRPERAPNLEAANARHHREHLLE